MGVTVEGQVHGALQPARGGWASREGFGQDQLELDLHRVASRRDGDRRWGEHRRAAARRDGCELATLAVHELSFETRYVLEAEQCALVWDLEPGHDEGDLRRDGLLFQEPNRHPDAGGHEDDGDDATRHRP